MNNNKTINNMSVEEVYSRLKIDNKKFKSIEELSKNYQRQIHQMRKDSIEKSAFFLR